MGEAGCDLSLVRRLAALAKLSLEGEDLDRVCRDIARIAEYLSEVGRAVRGRDVEPLYHVWEESSVLREGKVVESVNVRDFAPDTLDPEGRVRAPWRGSRG